MWYGFTQILSDILLTGVLLGSQRRGVLMRVLARGDRATCLMPIGYLGLNA